MKLKVLVFLLIGAPVFAQSVSDDYITVYQNTLSDLRNNSCPMFPSCSEYGREEFRTKPAIIAAASTADRMLRCGHEHDLYQTAISDKGYGLLDLNDTNSQNKANLFQPNKTFLAYSDFSLDTDQEKFIKSLINEQLHEYALYELLKLEFNAGVLTEEMFINRMICYEALGEFEKAIFDRRVNYSRYFSNALSYHMARIYYEVSNTEYLEELNVLEIDNEFYQSKILAIKLASTLKSEGLDVARLEAASFNMQERDISFLNRFVKKSNDIKYKSRNLAGILSVIPGLGYIYAGHKRTGFTSLLINSALAYTAIESFKNNNIGVGIMSSLFSISFYVGNLSGSKKSADRYNDKINRDLLRSLENNF